MPASHISSATYHQWYCSSSLLDCFKCDDPAVTEPMREVKRVCVPLQVNPRNQVQSIGALPDGQGFHFFPVNGGDVKEHQVTGVLRLLEIIDEPFGNMHVKSA